MLDEVVGVSVGDAGRQLRVAAVVVDLDQPAVGNSGDAQVALKLADEAGLVVGAERGLHRQGTGSLSAFFLLRVAKLGLPVEPQAADGQHGHGVTLQHANLRAEVVLEAPGIGGHRAILHQGGGVFAVDGEADHGLVLLRQAQGHQQHGENGGQHEEKNGEPVLAQDAQVVAQVNFLELKSPAVVRRHGSCGGLDARRLQPVAFQAGQLVFGFHRLGSTPRRLGFRDAGPGRCALQTD